MKHSGILVLALIGILLSAYALQLHFSNDGKSICNVGETFNCDKVNKSPWAEFLGIPVALLGLIAYLCLFLLVLKEKTWTKALGFTRKDAWQYLFTLVCVMCAFQLYLTFLEIFVIFAYCIVCLLSQAIILALVVLVWREWRH